MTQRLKRWESPRRHGRNDKGKGGSARARQLKKQQQMLRKKLQEGQNADDQKNQKNNPQGRRIRSLPLFFWLKPPKTGLTHCTNRYKYEATLLPANHTLTIRSMRKYRCCHQG